MAKTTRGYIGEERRGGKLFLFARFDYTDDTGARRSIKRRVKTRTEGNRLLPRLIRELEETGPASLDADKIAVNDFLKQQWLASAKQRLSPRTYQDYKDLLRRYVETSAVGKARLTKLTPLIIQALYTDMQGRQGLSARTVRYLHAVLASAFKQAVKWQLIPRNPASAVDLPKQARREMAALSPEDAKRFLDASSGDKYGLLFLVALVSGMRPEEYLALQWGDVDFVNNRVMVQRVVAWNREGGSFYFSEPKTAKSRRSIPLPGSVMSRLREHRREQAERRLKSGASYQNYDLVFASDAGTPLGHQNLSRRHFKKILEAAGLPTSMRLYDLRHSMATLMLSENKHPKVVSERLGHSSTNLTLDTYSHVLPHMQEDASAALERLLSLG